MKTKVYLGLSIRIIILFTIGMLATFLPDLLRDFFGDTPHRCTKVCVEHSCVGNRRDMVDHMWHWGKRHYWYAWMMSTLFILAMANLIIGSVQLVRNNYDTSNW